ncbi:MAG: SUMF1/EgtB/PvdO family nonheme iron enzyme [Phycisphaerae bacterium]
MSHCISRACTDGEYRLPSHDEWEYACRAGTDTAYFFGARSNADAYMWHSGNASGKRRPVGTRLPKSVGTVRHAG